MLNMFTKYKVGNVCGNLLGVHNKKVYINCYGYSFTG